jgi:hypothetical protein
MRRAPGAAKLTPSDRILLLERRSDTVRKHLELGVNSTVSTADGRGGGTR